MLQLPRIHTQWRWWWSGIIRRHIQPCTGKLKIYPHTQKHKIDDVNQPNQSLTLSWLENKMRANNFFLKRANFNISLQKGFRATVRFNQFLLLRMSSQKLSPWLGLNLTTTRAHGTTYNSCKFDHQMAPLVLLANLASRHNLDWFKIWSSGGAICIVCKVSHQAA